MSLRPSRIGDGIWIGGARGPDRFASRRNDEPAAVLGARAARCADGAPGCRQSPCGRQPAAYHPVD